MKVISSPDENVRKLAAVTETVEIQKESVFVTTIAECLALIQVCTALHIFLLKFFTLFVTLIAVSWLPWFLAILTFRLAKNVFHCTSISIFIWHQFIFIVLFCVVLSKYLLISRSFICAMLFCLHSFHLFELKASPQDHADFVFRAVARLLLSAW